MPKKERRQYSIEIETLSLLKAITWGSKMPENFPFEKTFGRIDSTDRLNQYLLYKLRKRDLQRLYLSRFGENTPRGSSEHQIIAMFVEKEAAAWGRTVSALINMPESPEEGSDMTKEVVSNLPPEEVVDIPISPLVNSATEKIPQSTDILSKVKLVQLLPAAQDDKVHSALEWESERKAIMEQLEAIDDTLRVVVELLIKPLIAAKAVGVVLEEQIINLDSIPEHLDDLSLTEIHKVQEQFDLAKIMNKHAAKMSILNRKKHLYSIKTVAENYELSYSEAEKAWNCHTATGFPVKHVVSFLYTK